MFVDVGLSSCQNQKCIFYKTLKKQELQVQGNVYFWCWMWRTVPLSCCCMFFFSSFRSSLTPVTSGSLPADTWLAHFGEFRGHRWPHVPRGCRTMPFCNEVRSHTHTHTHTHIPNTVAIVVMYTCSAGHSQQTFLFQQIGSLTNNWSLTMMIRPEN